MSGFLILCAEVMALEDGLVGALVLVRVEAGELPPLLMVGARGGRPPRLIPPIVITLGSQRAVVPIHGRIQVSVQAVRSPAAAFAVLLGVAQGEGIALELLHLIVLHLPHRRVTHAHQGEGEVARALPRLNIYPSY
jgi:hypothetical protein